MELAPERIKHVGKDEGTAYWEMGASLVSFKATSADTGGRYALFEVEDAAHSGPPMHRHTREDEAYFILEGEYEIHYPGGGAPLRLLPGAYVHVPLGTVHTYKCTVSGRMLVLLSPGGGEKFFADLGELALDRQKPPAHPIMHDPAEVAAIAARHGIEVLGPPA